MGLFQLKNNIIIIEPEVLFIPEFKQIWDRDKSKDKSQAYKELSYVFYTTDYKSPYSSYAEDKRETMILQDFIKDVSWKPDKLVSEAIRKYQELQETHSMRLLKSAKKACSKLEEYFQNVDLEEKDNRGQLLHKATDLSRALKEIGQIVESLNKVEEQIKKEVTTNEKIRGGGQTRSRER